jgi:hypothetical protein
MIFSAVLIKDQILNRFELKQVFQIADFLKKISFTPRAANSKANLIKNHQRL